MILFALLGIGTIGLATGLVAPLWTFHNWFPGDPSNPRTQEFSIAPPGEYFQSPVLEPGSTPPPQATLDLDIALWADLAFGIVAGVVAILRLGLGLRRASVPALTQGATVAAVGLAAVASVLLLALGPAAYAPGTNCPSCAAYSGQSTYTDWSWSPGVGTIGVVVAAFAFGAVLVREVAGIPDPGRWPGRLGGAGVVSGIALFSLVFGNDWQAWYPTGSPYLLLWILIVAIPTGSAAVAIRWCQRKSRSTGH